MNDLADRVRVLCARLLEAPPWSAWAAFYRSELKDATARLRAQQDQWNKAAEGDKHRDIARQSYRSRETDSAEGFSNSLKLFTLKKRDSDKEKG
jgi:hypothetical protein